MQIRLRRHDVEAILHDRLGHRVGHYRGVEAGLAALREKPLAQRCEVSVSATTIGGPARDSAGRLRSASRIAVRITPGHSTEAESLAPIAFRSLYRPSVRQVTPCFDAKYGPDAAQQPGHRRGVDDVAVVTARQHARHEGAQAVHHAHQVDAHDPVPVGQAGLPGRQQQRRRGHAGVVAQHVHRAELAVGRIGQGLDAGASATSTGTAMACAPAPAVGPARAASAAASMSASTSFMPAAAKRCASARPMPLAAPVTTATRPCSCCIVVSSSWVVPRILAEAASRGCRDGSHRAIGHDARPCCNCNT